MTGGNVVICYSGKSRPSAQRIVDENDSFEMVRGSRGAVNWGRAKANTRLNPDISNATNKRGMRILFQNEGVPMPQLFTRLEAESAIRFGNTVVGRPDHHTKGRGFWLCHSIEDIEKALRGTRRKKAATHFMEYIDAPHEYRVHIFKGKSIRISEKRFYLDETGHRVYTTIKPTGNVKGARAAAKQAVAALSLDFGCVDVLADDSDNCWTLEVNCAPGLGGSMPKLYSKVFKEWYDEQN